MSEKKNSTTNHTNTHELILRGFVVVRVGSCGSWSKIFKENV